MPRRHIDLQSQLPYHVGARCINRDWFSLPMEFVWEVMSEQLHFVRHSFQFEVHAFVLMNNHFHLIVRTPEANLSEGMAWFMRETSRTLTRAGNRINQTYGGRYFRSILETHHYYLHAYKYLYLNPVKAGLAETPWAYPFSTLPGLMGHGPLLIPVEEDQTLFNDMDATLRWLSTPPNEEDWKAVALALHRHRFRLARLEKREHRLESRRL